MAINYSTVTRRPAVRAWLVAGSLLVAGGCASTGSEGGWNNKAKGATIGASLGVLTGLITGDDAKERRNHALIGAGVGALAGTAVGAYMDAQENKLKNKLARTGVDVVRNGDDLILTMPSNITFDTARSDVKPEFHQVLGAVADVLTEYDKTYIDIAGHTDSQGEYSYNQQLSEQRASSVGGLLASQGILSERIVVQGYGESRPVAENTTAAGRAENRRVDLKLAPITQS